MRGIFLNCTGILIQLTSIGNWKVKRSKPISGIRNKRNFSELHEGIEGNYASIFTLSYFLIPYIMGWSLASQSNSIRGF